MEFRFVDWDSSYNDVILLNFTIILLIFCGLRKYFGIIANINASTELLEKNNTAFGISLAAITFAVAILLKGAIYGELANNMIDSSIAVGLYSIIGIGLMAVTRVIFDNIALPNISIRKEILQGNKSAAIIDAGNVIATAIIISTVMSWITTNTIERISILLVGYIISQIILTSTTYLRVKIFQRQNNQLSIEEVFKTGNIALALRFAGRKIGTAFAIAAASHIVSYELDYMYILLANWFLVSIIMVIILSTLSAIADATVLYKIDANKEILQKNNIAIGALQGILYISLGFLLSELVL